MIPPFLIFTLFTGGVHVAHSIRPAASASAAATSLMNPVTRNQVLAGKLGATIVFTLLALAVPAVAFWVMLPRPVQPESLGVTTAPDALRLALIVSVCLPLVFLASATQLLISAVTRSMVLEAQTSVGLLPLVPGRREWCWRWRRSTRAPLLAAIPTFGQTLLMGQVVRGEGVSAGLHRHHRDRDADRGPRCCSISASACTSGRRSSSRSKTRCVGWVSETHSAIWPRNPIGERFLIYSQVERLPILAAKSEMQRRPASPAADFRDGVIGVLHRNEGGEEEPFRVRFGVLVGLFVVGAAERLGAQRVL